jgi:hypothetical protein
MIMIFTILAYGENFTFWGLMFWSFKMKTPCMLIHPWIKKISQDNLIIIKHFKDEMTLKTTLLVCDAMVTSSFHVS